MSSVLGLSKTITLSAPQLQAFLAALSHALELAFSDGPVTINATSSIKEGDLSCGVSRLCFKSLKRLVM